MEPRLYTWNEISENLCKSFMVISLKILWRTFLESSHISISLKTHSYHQSIKEKIDRNPKTTFGFDFVSYKMTSSYSRSKVNSRNWKKSVFRLSSAGWTLLDIGCRWFDGSRVPGRLLGGVNEVKYSFKHIKGLHITISAVQIWTNIYLFSFTAKAREKTTNKQIKQN